jgi:hypothetical protein
MALGTSEVSLGFPIYPQSLVILAQGHQQTTREHFEGCFFYPELAVTFVERQPRLIDETMALLLEFPLDLQHCPWARAECATPDSSHEISEHKRLAVKAIPDRDEHAVGHWLAT